MLGRKSGTEDGFKIEQQENGGSWQLKCTVVNNTTEKEISGLTPGTNYCYRIYAYKGSVQSDLSNISCATTQSGVPAAPSNLSATGYCWEVMLTWQDNSNNESGFYIYREVAQEYNWIGSVGPNITTFWDTDLPCGSRWCYKVRAFNQYGNSPACSNRCVWTSPCYECEGGLGLKIIPEKDSVEVGANVTYTYILMNKGATDFTNVSVIDSVFGQIVTDISLKAGEEKNFTRTVLVSVSTTNVAEARGAYVAPTKETKYIAAHAIATVTIR